tara:strand:- start:4354 stop:5622 length:1269 start_codon:yes stop_codon:yes gene_type:complete
VLSAELGIVVVDLSKLSDGDQFVLERLRENGEAWIVGGWVRDHLAGFDPKELDIATDLTPSEVNSIFPRSIMVGEKYGTARVRIDDSIDGESIWEVTTLREDGGYGDGRRPDNVSFGSNIEIDLSRRDFTINAMAIDVSGTVIDPHGGEKDLGLGIVRSVGDAEERIAEDGLRLIRAFRFLDQGENGLRSLDGGLSVAISSNIGMLEKISKERIWSELKLILSGHNSSMIVQMMHEHRVLDEILEGLSFNKEVELCRNHCVNLALICSGDNQGGSDLSMVLSERLRLSRDEVASVSFLHDCRKLELDNSEESVRRFRAALPEFRQIEVLEYLSGLGRDVTHFELVLRNLDELQVGNSPLVDGNTLSERTGLEPGKRLGRLKGWLHRIQIENDISDSDEVLSRLGSMEWEISDPETWPILSWP